MWIHAKNGNVFEVPDDQADSLKVQGHLVFEKQADARKAKTPVDEPVVEPEPEN